MARSIASLLQTLLVTNLCFMALFWLVRIPIMNREHFVRVPESNDRDFHPVADSLFHSVLTQTTVGASAMVPVSMTAHIVTAVQCLSAMGSVLVVIIIASRRKE